MTTLIGEEPVYPGEIVAIVGRNGSGKSTLLRGVAGALDFTEGTIRYPTLEAQYEGRNNLISKLHLVEQAPQAFPGTVEFALRSYGALRGISRGINADEIAFVIERLGLAPFRDKHYSELSSGYRTRFELAKAMIQQPACLLLDEPLAPLDSRARRTYLRQLRDWANSARRPLCVLMTAVDVSQVGHVADRTLRVEHGTVLEVSSADHTRESSLFELVTRESDDVIVAALEKAPGLQIDLDVYPHLLTTPAGTPLNAVAQLLADAGLDPVHLRDVSDGETEEMPR